jgi:hypothetical protein
MPDSNDGPRKDFPFYNHGPCPASATPNKRELESGRGSEDGAIADSLNSPSINGSEDGSQPARKRRKKDDSSSEAMTPLTSPISKSPSTHDISHVPYHLSSIETVAKQMQAAVSEAWNRRFCYNAVFALLLYWEDDDLEVEPEITKLGATFREIYHYNTEIWKIGSDKPGLELKERLIHFLKQNDAKGNLIIFYYGGHAIPHPKRGGAPLWSS